ncbi:hypothetical protein AB0D08_22390 [Kitasatospora sp. NPDC048540]
MAVQGGVLQRCGQGRIGAVCCQCAVGECVVCVVGLGGTVEGP